MELRLHADGRDGPTPSVGALMLEATCRRRYAIRGALLHLRKNAHQTFGRDSVRWSHQLTAKQ